MARKIVISSCIALACGTWSCRRPARRAEDLPVRNGPGAAHGAVSQPRRHLSAGAGFGCVAERGTVQCWGRNDEGQAEAPKIFEKPILSVAAGHRHACAHLDGGRVLCWGASAAQLPQALEGVADLSAGTDFSCAALTDGSVRCWGRDDSGKRSPPKLEEVTAVAAGENHACALSERRRLTCWGKLSLAETSVEGGEAEDLESGTDWVCARTRSGKVSCWSGTPAGPIRVPVERADQISVGSLVGCAIASGAVTCWRFDGSPVPVPSETAEHPLEVAVGEAEQSRSEALCVRYASGKVGCWDLENGSRRSAPGLVRPSDTQLAVGVELLCFSGNNKDIRCLGGTGRGEDRPPAVDAEVRQLCAGVDHACALLSTGLGTCWGDDWAGQAPRQIPAAAEVTCAPFTTCAVLANGTLRCWGDGYSEPGQAVAHRDAPSPLNGLKRLALGAGAGCGVTPGGGLRCWRKGFTPVFEPLAGLGLTVHQVALGARDEFSRGHGCALATDGLAHCWGDNGNGQAAPPVRPAIPVGSRLIAGSSFTCTSSTETDPFCWGGLGTLPPAAAGARTFAASPAAGRACVLGGRGIVCWGEEQLILPYE